MLDSETVKLHGQAHGLGEFVQQMLMEDVFLDNSKFPTVRNKQTNRKRKAEQTEADETGVSGRRGPYPNMLGAA